MFYNALAVRRFGFGLGGGRRQRFVRRHLETFPLPGGVFVFFLLRPFPGIHGALLRGSALTRIVALIALLEAIAARGVGSFGIARWLGHNDYVIKPVARNVKKERPRS